MSPPKAGELWRVKEQSQQSDLSKIRVNLKGKGSGDERRGLRRKKVNPGEIVMVIGCIVHTSDNARWFGRDDPDPMTFDLDLLFGGQVYKRQIWDKQIWNEWWEKAN